MKSKKKKNNNKPIDFKALEDKLNVFTFMHNDFNKIVDKENEICNSTIDIHSIKEKDSLSEKEKIQTILSELISSCEEKKKKLNNYINVTQNVINKNNDIIEKEKIEIANLITEKNTCIEKLQRKIDCLKEAHCSLNIAIINVFNNLNSFINDVTKGKVNIEEMVKTDIISLKKDKANSCEDDNEASIQGSTQNEERWRKKICDEHKMKLFESINIYRSKLKQIKLLINNNNNNNTNFENEILGFNEDKSKNDAIPYIDPSVSIFHRDENSEKGEVTTFLCDENMQDSILLTKDNIPCDTIGKIKKGDIQNTSRQDTIENVSGEDYTSIVEEETDEEETDEEETDEEETDKEATDEEETDEEETDEEETDEEKMDEEETDEEKTDEEETDEEETDEDCYIQTYENEKKREDSSDKSKIIDENDDKNDDKNEQETLNVMKSVVADTRKNLSEMRNDDKNENKKNNENDILYFDSNQCFIEKKDMLFEGIKNLDFDYLSYFQQKLKNS